jgi:hypothetical protein
MLQIICYIYAVLHVSASVRHLQGDDDTKEFVSTHIVNNDMLNNVSLCTHEQHNIYTATFIAATATASIHALYVFGSVLTLCFYTFLCVVVYLKIVNTHRNM